MPKVNPGRKPAFVPTYHESGLIAVRQPKVHGQTVSYDPDWNAWCIHGEYDIVLHRFDVAKPSAIKNLIERCRKLSLR